MKLTFNKEFLLHIKEISNYNNNYYSFQFDLEDCNVLHEVAEDYTNELQYSIGIIKDGLYIAKWFFEPTVNQFELNLDTKNKEMIWY